jgi:hypothetical protein
MAIWDGTKKESTMPLIKTGTEESVGKNISIEKHAHKNMPIKQAVAIAENTKREAAKDDCPFGAKAPGAAKMVDFAYKDAVHEHGALPARVTHAQMTEAAKALWKTDADDKSENGNGIVTPEG